jgi:apolipoprotein N-acyltransferase
VGELGFIAVAPLVFVFGLYPGLFGWLVSKARSDGAFAVAAVGGWAALEALRVRFPVGGFEWGLAGYPMGEYEITRSAADLIGTSGWGVLLMFWAVGLFFVWRGRWKPLLLATAAILGLLIVSELTPERERGATVPAAIVQGSTPCPLTHCLNERRATYEMHLALTRTIAAGSVDLVVWPEGSTGSFDADPVLNPDVEAALSAQADRIGAAFLVGGDRPLSDTEWVNALVAWNHEGEVLAEYRKRHPVPFGEYIPARPLFDWIPDLSQVPRDMIRGAEPGVFDFEFGRVGAVISFEGAFARYARDVAGDGAQLLVVASNEGSYEFTSVSEQFIGMTRMRAAELGVDVIHAAVTGRSTFITNGGEIGDTAGFLEERVLAADLRLASGPPTLYTRWGEWVQGAAILGSASFLLWRQWRQRRSPRLPE